MSHHFCFLSDDLFILFFPPCHISVKPFCAAVEKQFSPMLLCFSLFYSTNVLSEELFVLQNQFYCRTIQSTNNVFFSFFRFSFFSSFKWKLFIFPFAKVPTFSKNFRSIQTSHSVITSISSFHGHFLLLLEITGQQCRQFTLFSILN